MIGPKNPGRSMRRSLPEILENGENGVSGIAREVFADAAQQLAELDAGSSNTIDGLRRSLASTTPRSG